jgi:cytochrome c2
VCSACHSTDPGKNGIGPSLAGVYGKKAAHLASYDYSEAMEKSGLTWNDAGLNRFLTDPQGVVPGTKMAYPGLKDAARRRAMIDYLKTL